MELIAVIVLIGILAAAASGPLIQGLTARQEVATDLETVGQLRYATERIVRELRQAQFVPTGSGFQITPLQPKGTSSSAGICFTRVGGTAGTTLTTVTVQPNATSNATAITYVLPSQCGGAASPSDLYHPPDGTIISLNFDYWGFYNPNSATCVNPQVSPVNGLCPIGVNNITSFQDTVNIVDVTLTRQSSGGAVLSSQRTRVLLENGSWQSVF